MKPSNSVRSTGAFLALGAVVLLVVFALTVRQRIGQRLGEVPVQGALQARQVASARMEQWWIGKLRVAQMDANAYGFVRWAQDRVEGKDCSNAPWPRVAHAGAIPARTVDALERRMREGERACLQQEAARLTGQEDQAGLRAALLQLAADGDP